MEKVKGQVVKIQTTADECIRLVIDIDASFAGNVNLLTWKNNMVDIELEEENGQ